MPWQDSRIQEAAAELPVGFPAPLGGGRRAPQGRHDLQPGGEGAPTPNVSAAPSCAVRHQPRRLCASSYATPLRQRKNSDQLPLCCQTSARPPLYILICPPPL